MIKSIIVSTLFIPTLFANGINNYVDQRDCDKIIDKKVYKVCYSYKHKGALAVWYNYIPPQ
jgi:endonuclease G